MTSWFRSLVLALVAVGLLVVLRVTSTAHAEGCQFVLGFAVFNHAIPGLVGNCLENEQHNPINGDGLQHTTQGLMVWRKADNFTAFTNGYRTIVNGPTGLEDRLNTQRFAWEANPDGLPVVQDAQVGRPSPPGVDPQAGPRLHIVDSTTGYVQGPLVFHIAVSGFHPGESVTVAGTYVPYIEVATGMHQSPSTGAFCTPVPLGPVQVLADAMGGFTATLQAPENLHTGGQTTITAMGTQSGLQTGATEVVPEGAQVPALPAGCHEINPPA